MNEPRRGFRPFSWFSFLALGPLVFSACHASGSLPGDRCKVNDDCKAPMVCSTKADPDASEGICVYPDALPMDAGTVDAAQEDAAVPPDADDGTCLSCEAGPPDAFGGC